MTWWTASTRWSALSPTAGWDGSTWRSTTACRIAGSSSRGCSTQATSRPWRRPSPSASSWPRWTTPDRQDLQLRRTRWLRLHRDGVRGRGVAPRCGAHQRGDGRPAAADPGHRLRARDPAGLRVPAPSGPAVLRLQTRQRHPERGAAQADRPGRCPAHPTTMSATSTARSAIRRPRCPIGRHHLVGPVHRGADPGRAQLRLPRLSGRGALCHQPAGAVRTWTYSATTSRSVGSSRGNGDRSDRPVRVRRRDGGPAHRGPARGYRERRGIPPPAPSTLFSAELGPCPTLCPWDQLPVPAVDPNDPASGVSPRWPWWAPISAGSFGDRAAFTRTQSLHCSFRHRCGRVRRATQELDSEEAVRAVGGRSGGAPC